MSVPSSGKLLVRLPQHTYSALSASGFPEALVRTIFGGGIVGEVFAAAQDVAGFLAYAVSGGWVLHEPATFDRSAHPWDTAHNLAGRMASGDNGVQGVYVEPDLLHPFRAGTFGQVRSTPPSNPAQGPQPPPPYPPQAGIGDLEKAYRPDAGTAFSPGWHIERARFPAAWQITKGEGVRIAHLDIGYWNQHYSTPLRMRPDLGWNFYDPTTAGQQNTQDLGAGLLNSGHGTGTLGLLAGKQVDLIYPAPGGGRYAGFLGGAPEAEVVPVKVAGLGGGVIELYTSCIAQGLNYALHPNDPKPCDVVSLSHGGLPTRAWAKAVNDLYETGIVVAAAAGDSFSDGSGAFPTHQTYYPSAFNRVVTATGVTFDNLPYKTSSFGVLQGSWGPHAIMGKSIGGYTPNVPWMARGTQYGWDMNGGGTSASTPQIAAACALWLAAYGAGLKGWQRVAACREALFRSANHDPNDFEEIGVGRLDADRMLDPVLADTIQKLALANKLPHIPPDEVSFPFFRLLFGLPTPNAGTDEMFETEALQLVQRTPNPMLRKASARFQAQGSAAFTTAELNQLRDAFLTLPLMSSALSQHLQKLLPIRA